MNSRSKLLIVCPGLHIGGVERSLIGLLSAMDPEKHDVTLFLYSHDGAFMPMLPAWVKLLPQSPQYAALDRPLKSLLFSAQWKVGLARLAAKIVTSAKRGFGRPGALRPRAIRYCMPFLPGIPGEYDLAIGFLAPHDPVLRRVHATKKAGWIHTDYSAIETSFDARFEAKSWLALDALVAVSSDTARSFCEIFPECKGKTHVIENLLSASFVRAQAKMADVSSEMPYEAGVSRICSVGRLAHPKGFDHAAQACRLLIKRGLRIKWYVVGYGPDEKVLRGLIKDMGISDSFILLGPKVNPYPYMAAADLYVQPSRYEGKAVTVREAQMLGLPVMITRYPSAACQLEEGADGYIAELGPAGIADGIEVLLRDDLLRGRIAATASQRDYSNYGELAKLMQLMPLRANA